METELSLQLLRVVEQAAIGCARTMGLGDRHESDRVATEVMRSMMDQVAMDGTIVIGEGERDEAPMLFIGEKVGAGAKHPEHHYPAVDIAVDPLGVQALRSAANAFVLTRLPERLHERRNAGDPFADHQAMDVVRALVG
ncbi:MAG TPA: fructose-bisphosphatase class II, partial [bacterium]